MSQINSVSAPERAAKLFRQQGGILRMADIIRGGITRNTLYAMRDTGQVQQLARGLYRLAEMPPLSQSDLVTDPKPSLFIMKTIRSRRGVDLDQENHRIREQVFANSV